MSRTMTVLVRAAGRLVVLLIVGVVATNAHAQERLVDRHKPASDDRPMQIDADRMIIHEQERRATFEGGVHVRQGDLLLQADRLDVWVKHSPVTEEFAYGSGNISKISAQGHVQVTQGSRNVTADEAIFDQERQELVLIGNLSGRDGDYQVAGDKMVIYLEEQRSVIEGSRIIIPPSAVQPGPTE
jgi:lipopolysaccharide export system protein LptA